MEDGEVGAIGEDPAARSDEDAPAGAGAVPLKVIAEQGNQGWVNRYGSRLAGRAVLELAALAGSAVVGPVGADASLGREHLGHPGRSQLSGQRRPRLAGLGQVADVADDDGGSLPGQAHGDRLADAGGLRLPVQLVRHVACLWWLQACPSAFPIGC